MNIRAANLSFSLFAATLLSSTLSAQSREFGGYVCTDDCSGHKAGYEWAEENNVSSVSQCTWIIKRWPKRTSFYEGCLVYVDDPYRGADEDDDGDEID
jgi:hypothetical protein